MEMDKMGVLTSFIHNIVVYNIPLLYGTVGEIVVEKSGSLNLGVEGIMAVGAIFGYICGCYANSLGVGIAVAFLAGALCGLLFAALGAVLALVLGGLVCMISSDLMVTLVPIVPACVNFKRKEIYLKETFYPTGDFMADLPVIMKYFEDVEARHPEKYNKTMITD